MLSMDQVAVLRHKPFVEGQSVRKVARDMGLSRNTVRRYRGLSEPMRFESRPRRRPTLDRVRDRVDAILEEWSTRTGGKQRVTGSRVLRQLREEGYRAGHTLVRAYPAEKAPPSGAAGPLPWYPSPMDITPFDAILARFKPGDRLRTPDLRTGKPFTLDALDSEGITVKTSSGGRVRISPFTFDTAVKYLSDLGYRGDRWLPAGDEMFQGVLNMENDRVRAASYVLAILGAAEVLDIDGNRPNRVRVR